MSLETAFWVLLVVNVVGLWYLHKNQKQATEIIFPISGIQDDLGFVEKKLGITEETKRMMYELEMSPP
jgi:hypothetical protein